MKKKITNLAVRLGELAGSFVRRFTKNTGERTMHDVGRGSLARTIVLRERVLRIELSRSKTLAFIDNNKKALSLFCVAFVILVFARYALIGFASTAEFYPSSCLGSWENVANALGKPDLLPGAPASSFSGVNAALFGTSTAQIFCGNFSGETDIATLEAKSLDHADLVLSWTFVFPTEAEATSTVAAAATATTTEAASSSVSGGGGGGTGGAEMPQTGEPVSSSEPEVALPTETVMPTSSEPAPVVPAPETVAPPPAETQSSTNAPAPVATPPAETQSSTDAPAPVATPPPAETLPPADAPTPSPTTWLRKILAVAYAEEPASTEIQTSTVATGTSATPDAPRALSAITVDTSMFQNIILPSSTSNDILSIVYSTDGTTWLPVLNINKDNWANGRYALPIRSWQELRHLQIAFVGLGAADAPRIYLDAVAVEASYVDTAEGVVVVKPDEASTTVQSDAVITDELQPQIPPEDIIQQSSVPESDVFQQGARQQCVAVPFSHTIDKGTSADFSIELFSGLSATSSQNGIHPIYAAQLGSLPVGVTASIVDGPSTDASSTKTIHLRAGSRAAQGSYSLLILYRERQDDGSMRSTACQLNLVIR